MQNKQHEIQSVTFEKDQLCLTVDGERHAFQLSEISPRLLNADKQARETFRIAPSGYGIHWELIDEDLSIDGLFGIQHTPPGTAKENTMAVAEPSPHYPQ